MTYWQKKNYIFLFFIMMVFNILIFFNDDVYFLILRHKVEYFYRNIETPISN